MSEQARHLHLIDLDSGETFEECPGCAELNDVAKGLERKIRGLIMENANLRRDKEREAKASGLWPIAVKLFAVWRKATKSKAKFRYDRFEKVEPFLRDYVDGKHEFTLKEGPPRNPLEECLAAIVGRVDDHFSNERANGTTKHYWEWERIFDSSKEFDESQRRRPRDWRERVAELAPDLVADDPIAPDTPAESPPPSTVEVEQVAMLRPVDAPQIAPDTPAS